jgi:hypothetical protein
MWPINPVTNPKPPPFLSHATHQFVTQSLSEVGLDATGLTELLDRKVWISDKQWSTCIRYEVFTVVAMKNAVFWDVVPCGSCKNPLQNALVASYG